MKKKKLLRESVVDVVSFIFTERKKLMCIGNFYCKKPPNKLVKRKKFVFIFFTVEK